MPEQDEEEIQEMTNSLAAANETSSATTVVSELYFFSHSKNTEKYYRLTGTKGFH